MRTKNNTNLPVEIVFHPSWWFKNAGITFDEDFFFHPVKRVESEKAMARVLYERFGQFGVGENRDKSIPYIGAVHLAAGYMLSGMLGCRVEFREDSPPEVIPAENETFDLPDAFNSPLFKKLERLCDNLKTKYSYLAGDVNWSGILNLALDLRGEMIFVDMFDSPEELKNYFQKLAGTIERFTAWILAETGSTSISVNRMIGNFEQPVFLHSECSHTMISEEQYREFIFPIDREWSKKTAPFGIHFCGHDPHRFAEIFSELPHLDFLDVGWGGDIKALRRNLSDTFFNIRLSPVDIVNQNSDEIEKAITRLVSDSDSPSLTGICCINMDYRIKDEQVCAIFETASKLRKQYKAGPHKEQLSLS